MRVTFPLLCCVVSVLARSAETPVPPSPTSWVTDTARFMSPQAAQALDKRLEAYERSSGKHLR